MVSVIIPVYNTEKYLDKCIESVVNQSYKEIEIILVDDGSKDMCPQICDNWANIDKRIKVIHQKNKGAGMARNAGIENAKGEFICFCDSDDYLACDTVEKTYGVARDTNAEIVIYGMNSVDDNYRILSTIMPLMEKRTYSGKEIMDIVVPEMIAPDPCGDGKIRLYMSNCILLYSRNLIERTGWRFDSERDVYSEDVYSLLVLLTEVRRLAILPEALYFYRKNNASISRIYRPNRYQTIRSFYIKTKKMAEERGCVKEAICRLNSPFINFTIAAIKQEVASSIPRECKIENLKRIVEDEVLQKALREYSRVREPLRRRFLFWAMCHKQIYLCYALVLLQNLRDKLR